MPHKSRIEHSEWVTTNYAKGANGQPGDSFTTEGIKFTERETEEIRLEEMAGRRLLRPGGCFPPKDREGWGRGKVSVNVNKLNWPGGEGESGAGGGRQGTEGRWARGERGGGLEGPAGRAGSGAHYKL